MSSADTWSTVLEIASVGSVQLFGYLAGLVALMYALTSPALYELLGVGQESARADVTPGRESAIGAADAEAHRRLQAVALAVAAACASTGRPPGAVDARSQWRRVQRARRFAQPTARQRARS